MATLTLIIVPLTACSVAQFRSRPKTPENRTNPSDVHFGTPREPVATTEQKVERLLSGVRPALRDFVLGNKPLPIWEAPSDADPDWISHVKGLCIPRIGAEPNLLLINLETLKGANMTLRIHRA